MWILRIFLFLQKIVIYKYGLAISDWLLCGIGLGGDEDFHL